MLNVGVIVFDFMLCDQNQQFVILCGYWGVKNVLLVFFLLVFMGICQGELDQLCDYLFEFENDDSVVLVILVGLLFIYKIWVMQSGFMFLLLLDFWLYGVVSQVYGVFNEQVGIVNWGIFVVDWLGIIWFVEMKQLGEVCDQWLWIDVLVVFMV